MPSAAYCAPTSSRTRSTISCRTRSTDSSPAIPRTAASRAASCSASEVTTSRCDHPALSLQRPDADIEWSACAATDGTDKRAKGHCRLTQRSLMSMRSCQIQPSAKQTLPSGLAVRPVTKRLHTRLGHRRRRDRRAASPPARRLAGPAGHTGRTRRRPARPGRPNLQLPRPSADGVTTAGASATPGNGRNGRGFGKPSSSAFPEADRQGRQPAAGATSSMAATKVFELTCSAFDWQIDAQVAARERSWLQRDGARTRGCG